jgi:GTP cyclohydrolase I
LQQRLTSIGLSREVKVRDSAHLLHPAAPDFDEVGDCCLDDLIRRVITGLGEDVSREGLLKTPQRVERSLRFLTSGYQVKLEDIINGALFAAEGSEMVVVKGIEFYSLCEHHMLPFFGKAHIAYIPNQRILGLSKFARVVDVFARRMQVQERMTSQIADSLTAVLEPKGIAVVTEASHLCMMMRGVEKQGSTTRTHAMRGVFRDDARTRQEFLDSIRP